MTLLGLAACPASDDRDERRQTPTACPEGEVRLRQPEPGVRVESHFDGCVGCRAVVPGAPAGAPCAAAAVCTQHCCSSPREEGTAAVRVRACIRGHCADRTAACARR